MPLSAPSTASTPEKARLLVADDQPHILEALLLLLKGEGYAVHIARSPAEARAELCSETFDAALLDLNYTRDTTSGGEDLALLRDALAYDGELPVIAMTAWDNIERCGGDAAWRARLRAKAPGKCPPAVHRSQPGGIARCPGRARALEAENVLLRAPGRPTLIAAAPSMRPLLEAIARIGPSDANVMITGEHGTGKEVIAQTLRAVSLRAKQAMVAVNTGALPEGTF